MQSADAEAPRKLAVLDNAHDSGATGPFRAGTMAPSCDATALPSVPVLVVSASAMQSAAASTAYHDDACSVTSKSTTRLNSPSNTGRSPGRFRATVTLSTVTDDTTMDAGFVAPGSTRARSSVGTSAHDCSNGSGKGHAFSRGRLGSVGVAVLGSVTPETRAGVKNCVIAACKSRAKTTRYSSVSAFLLSQNGKDQFPMTCAAKTHSFG
mmetsp:Transcript_48560/g.149915  ORF Transcript_48560/g.149915 Transcript_48560/m.149915 type:complete len:209 (+) Transcript_48560:664-1290(+)